MAGEDRSIFNVKLSSTVPENVTPEGTVYNFKNTDLAMKLHYINALYFFNSKDVEGLDLDNFKEPTFSLLDVYFMTSGRIRRPESSRRPFIKCNDSGLRFIEAQCTATLDDCICALRSGNDLCRQFIYRSAIGPVLHFSPLVYLQVTRFKCGGVSLGLSWAHVLGDAMALAGYLNLYAGLLSGERASIRLLEPDTGSPNPTRAVKRVEPVGDHWVVRNSVELVFHSLFVDSDQVKLRSGKITQFEALSAIIWRCLGRIRDSAARVVTICRDDTVRGENSNPRNLQRVSVVEVDFDVAEAELLDLACILVEKTADESFGIEEMTEEDDGDVDLLLYGGNLTFVSLQHVDIYGMKIRGRKPVLANFYVEGVGDAGAVVMVPRLCENGDVGGWIVNVTLRENEVEALKSELAKEWSLL